jgi:hypothetical protein
MITHSGEFPRTREFDAYERMITAVRAYADATHHNALITEETVAERARLTFRLEQARLDDHRRTA